MNSEEIISYLALGSNIGNTKQNIENAIFFLQEYDIKVLKVAPFYYNPPLLLPDAKEDFYKPFCNTVVKIATSLTPESLLLAVKNIERKMSRPEKYAKWSPRIIDIDILTYGGLEIATDSLTIPHKEMLNRSFVLDPLAYLDSNLNINSKNILQESRQNKTHLPVIMGILNITDNSFSNDGLCNMDKIEAKIQEWIDEGIAIIDIGAEATNPNAKQLTHQEEIERLTPLLQVVKKHSSNLSTRFSIDTYHYETAKLAIENGFKIINDVSGFKDERMYKLLQDNDIEAVIMHSLTVPADKNVNISNDQDPILTIKEWAEDIISKCESYGIDLSKIIIDSGIGFNKTAFQSLKIIQDIGKLQTLPCRILIGHSKKSFMNLFTNHQFQDRMIETLGISIALQEAGVDIIRVHDPIEHKRMLLSKLSAINLS